MDRLFVFSDLHGSYSGWLTLQALLNKNDGLAVAGDLFDTRYGSHGNPDYAPDQIRSDLKDFAHPFFYVYGNCDVEGFFPGHGPSQGFEAFGKSIFLHHGHRKNPVPYDADIIIQGHTHLCELEAQGGQIFLNPGSIVLPRNSLPTYAVMDKTGIALVHLTHGQSLARIDF